MPVLLSNSLTAPHEDLLLQDNAQSLSVQKRQGKIFEGKYCYATPESEPLTKFNMILISIRTSENLLLWRIK